MTIIRGFKKAWLQGYCVSPEIGFWGKGTKRYCICPKLPSLSPNNYYKRIVVLVPTFVTLRNSQLCLKTTHRDKAAPFIALSRIVTGSAP